MRKMDNPYDRLLLDPIKIEQPELARAHGVSVLEYEPTIPTKFMVGSEHGMVFNCNKKWKQPTDKILAKVLFNIQFASNNLYLPSTCILDVLPLWSSICC